MTAQPVEHVGVEVGARPRLRLLPVPVNEPPLVPLAVVAVAAVPAPEATVVPAALPAAAARTADVPRDVPPAVPAGGPAPGSLTSAPGRRGTAAPQRTTLVPAAPPAPAQTGLRPVLRRASAPLPLVVPEDEDGRARAEHATPTADLPAPDRWAGQFVQAATEVAVGLRPAVQLVRWTSEDVYSRLARRGDVASRARRAGRLGSPQGPAGRPRVRSVRTCELRDGIVEASAVVSDADRTRAVALRLEGLDGRWRVTVLELG